MQQSPYLRRTTLKTLPAWKLRVAVRGRIAAIALLCAFPPEAASEEHRIRVSTGRFAPETVTVRPGDTLTWANDSLVAHQLLFRRDPRAAGASPLNRVVTAGRSLSITVERTGVFEYMCQWHSMFGTIRVTAPD